MWNKEYVPQSKRRFFIMITVLCEKPDIAKAVSKILPDKAKWENGYIEQGNYYVTWAYGHLLTLCDPEDYGEQYRRKSTPNSALPIFFEDWKMKVAPSVAMPGAKGKIDKEKQLNTIGKLLKKSDCVIIAGDVDDEGQLLTEDILDWFGYTVKKKRLDTSSLNPESLKPRFANLMNNDDWHTRAVSRHARSVRDYFLGINGSRFFSNIYAQNLSVGRVQTAALGLVVNRDAQIENHTAQKYFNLSVNVSPTNNPDTSYTLTFVPSKDNPHLTDGKFIFPEYLNKMGQAIKGRKFNCVVSKSIVYDKAPLPFSISALKSEAQKLRMDGGLITYNRSECRYLPENMHPEADKVNRAIFSNIPSMAKFQGLVDYKMKSEAFNDKNIGVHHAIIPTIAKRERELSEDEEHIYGIICKYYMAQFAPLCKKEKTEMKIEGKGGNIFSGSSFQTLDLGWKEILEEKPEEIGELSKLPAGTYEVIVNDFKIEESETKPPARYTDASLENDMKSAAKYITDPEAKRLLLEKDKGNKEEHGSIGTAATRSAIIKSLKTRGFLKNEGKKLISTTLGREFYALLPDEIKKPDLTAKFWSYQQGIIDGTSTPQDLYNEMFASFDRIKNADYSASKITATKNSDKKVICKCPNCNSPVWESEKAFYCSNWENCKFAVWKKGDKGVYKLLNYSKKKITATAVKKLVENGKVEYELTSEKTGKKYKAFITLNKQTDGRYYLGMEFKNSKK